MMKIQQLNHGILSKFPKIIPSLNHQLYPPNVNFIEIPIAPVDRGGSVDGCTSFKISFTSIIKGIMDVLLIAKSFLFIYNNIYVYTYVQHKIPESVTQLYLK